MLKRTITNMKNPEGLNSNWGRQKKPPTLSQGTADRTWTQQSVHPRTGRTKAKKKGQSLRNLWAPSGTPTHTLGAPEERKERGRKNISRNNGCKIPTSDENHYSTYSRSSTNFTWNKLTYPHLDRWTYTKIKVNLESSMRRLTTPNWAPMYGNLMPTSKLNARKMRVKSSICNRISLSCVYAHVYVLHTHICTHTCMEKTPNMPTVVSSGCEHWMTEFLFFPFLCSFCLIRVYFLFSKIIYIVPLKVEMH